MSKEFIWTLDFDGDVVDYRVVLGEGEVITYENGQESEHLKITNPESKQNVLQIDTVTVIHGQEVPFQLEKDVPYIKLGDKWSMSATTFEDRKKKLVRTNKMAAYIQAGFGAALCVACLIKYLVTGELGNWWFMIIMGTFMAGMGFVQYKDIKDQVAQLDQLENA